VRRALVAAVLAAAVLPIAPPPAGAQTAGAEPELLVRLRGPADAAALRRLEQRSGGRVRRVLPASGLVRVALPEAARGREAAAARELAGDPAVASARPHGRGRGGFVPDDPLFGAQWHLRNEGQTGGVPGADIGATAAWRITRGSAEVRVAILDSGIEFDHPDLVGRLEPGFDFVNDDADPSADHPHGVQVTGLFGANADNGVQVAGVDHAARILPGKVLDEDNAGWTADLIEALYWAAGLGADVIVMSLIDYPADPELRAALQHARAAGAVLVACAGNHGPGDADRSAPGLFPETISVGWTDATDGLGQVGASSSATGAALDVVAPGTLTYTITSTGGLPFFSGCSAATPIVGGIASLLLAVDPTLTHEDVAAILAASAADQVGPPVQDLPGRDDFFGHGRVDAAAALARVPEPEGAAAALAALLALAAAARPRWPRRAPRARLLLRGRAADAEGLADPSLPLPHRMLQPRSSQLLVAGHPLAPLLAPLPREGARADLLQHPLHARAHVEVEEADRPGHRAVLAGVGVVVHLVDDAVAHHAPERVGQLARVEDLEQDRLGRKAGLDQGLHRARERHAEGRPEALLVEEVEGGLVGAREFEAASPGGADAASQRQHALLRAARCVPVHADEAREAPACEEELAHAGPDHARRHHHHVDLGRRIEVAEGEVVARGDVDAGARAQARADLRLEHLGHHLVRDQQQDDVGLRHGLRRLVHGEALGRRGGARLVVAHADPHVETGVAQVEGLGAALVAVAEHGDALAGQRVEARVGVPVDPGGGHARAPEASPGLAGSI
jgi:hypothetical protein